MKYNIYEIYIVYNMKYIIYYKYMHKYIYIPILYVMRITQNKNDSINSILQHGRVDDNNCFVLSPTLKFPCLILCHR